MKKLLTLLLVFFSLTFVNGQNYISGGLDPALLIRGAYDHDDTPVAAFSFNIMATEGSNEIGIFVEYANLDPLYAAGGIAYNRVIFGEHYDGLKGLLGMDVGVIHREFAAKWFEEDKTLRTYRVFGTTSLNATLRYDFGGVFLQTRLNYRYRRDLDIYYDDSYPFVLSGAVEFGVKF